MAADHINYEEDFNLRYKVPPVITNLTMRLACFWAVGSVFFIIFCLGDMNKLFTPHEYYYPGAPKDVPENPTRYETMYFIDRAPRVV